MLRFDTDGLPWQRSLRWDRVPVDRRLLLLGLLVALALTVTELAVFGFGMKHQIARELRPASKVPIEVVLIEPPPTFEIPPEPEPPALKARPSRVKVEAPKVKLPPPPVTAEDNGDAMRARMGEAGAGDVQLFNADGSVRLGTQPSAPKRPLNPHEAGRERWAEMEKRGDNPLDCRKTRFAGAFTPDESLGDKVSRKYLKWIGLSDPEAISHRDAQRAQRAAEGCDPAR